MIQRTDGWLPEGGGKGQKMGEGGTKADISSYKGVSPGNVRCSMMTVVDSTLLWLESC